MNSEIETVQKLIANEHIFNERDSRIQALHHHAFNSYSKYNQLVKTDAHYHDEILRSLFNQIGTDLYIEPDFHCQFGFNISLGDEVFLNHDCTLQDFAPITIGNQANIAPRVGLYTANAPEKADREPHSLIAKPIVVKNNVWIGGNAVIMGGVTIGENAIIGAGCVVDHDVPANALAVGNPMQIKKI